MNAFSDEKYVQSNFAQNYCLMSIGSKTSIGEKSSDDSTSKITLRRIIFGCLSVNLKYLFLDVYREQNVYETFGTPLFSPAYIKRNGHGHCSSLFACPGCQTERRYVQGSRVGLINAIPSSMEANNTT